MLSNTSVTTILVGITVCLGIFGAGVIFAPGTYHNDSGVNNQYAPPMENQGESTDDYPEVCSEAPVFEPGIHSGTIDSPGDMDVFRINVDESDYISAKITIEEDESGPVIWHSNGERGVDTSISDVHPKIMSFDNIDDSSQDPSLIRLFRGHEYEDDNNRPSSWSHQGVYKIFPASSGYICIAISDTYANPSVPYDWEYRFAVSQEPSWWSDLKSQINNEDSTPSATANYGRVSELDKVPSPETATVAPTTTTTMAPRTTTTGTQTLETTVDSPQPTVSARSQSPTEESESASAISTSASEVESPTTESQDGPADESGQTPGFGLLMVIAVLFGGIIFLNFHRRDE